MNKRYQNALLKNADGEMVGDDFQEVEKLTKGQIEKLEGQLNDLASVGTEIRDLNDNETTHFCKTFCFTNVKHFVQIDIFCAKYANYSKRKIRSHIAFRRWKRIS